MRTDLLPAGRLRCTEPGCAETYRDDPRRATTFCKRHASTAAARDPARRAKVSAGIAAKHADPSWKAMRKPILSAAIARAYADPAKGARMREAMRRTGQKHGGSVAGSESRKRAGRSYTERMIGHIPMEYRDHYRALQSKTHMSAAEVTAAIQEMIAADQRTYARTGKLPQQERAAR